MMSDLELIPMHLQILLQARQPCSSNIIPIQIIQNVHKNNHRQQPEIDLPSQGIFKLLSKLGTHISDEFWSSGLFVWDAVVNGYILNNLELVEAGFIYVFAGCI